MKRTGGTQLRPRAKGGIPRLDMAHAKNISIRVIGEWEHFELFDGDECHYRWSAPDNAGQGEDLAAWLAFQAIPLLRRFAERASRREPRANFRRPPLKAEIIKEVAADFFLRRPSSSPMNLVGILLREVNFELRRRARLTGCDESIRRNPTVTEQYLRRVLKRAGYGVPSAVEERAP